MPPSAGSCRRSRSRRGSPQWCRCGLPPAVCLQHRPLDLVDGKLGQAGAGAGAALGRHAGNCARQEQVGGGKGEWRLAAHMLCVVPRACEEHACRSLFAPCSLGMTIVEMSLAVGGLLESMGALASSLPLARAGPAAGAAAAEGYGRRERRAHKGDARGRAAAWTGGEQQARQLTSDLPPLDAANPLRAGCHKRLGSRCCCRRSHAAAAAHAAGPGPRDADAHATVQACMLPLFALQHVDPLAAVSVHKHRPAAGVAGRRRRRWAARTPN